MQIEIEIPEPPKGYGNPRRGPLYLPFADELVLIGKSWIMVSDITWQGGSYWIYCTREKVKTV